MQERYIITKAQAFISQFIYSMQHFVQAICSQYLYCQSFDKVFIFVLSQKQTALKESKSRCNFANILYFVESNAK